MNGLLLHLLNDPRGTPGKWFWPCLMPLRAEINRWFWIIDSGPWMGAPAGFDSEREVASFEGMAGTGVSLWQPGVVGRWAERFCEEYIELWAVDPADDPAQMAADFDRTRYDRQDAFIEKHAAIWLIYTACTCWEIFARESQMLQSVREHLRGSTAVRVYESSSQDRDQAFGDAGLGDLWRAMRG